jgi:hypothetical protein
MRNLADRHRIRKPRVAVDPEYREVSVNRDREQTYRARQRRSSAGIELDGGDEPCGSNAWRGLVGEFGTGGEAGGVWEKRGGFRP